jgi:hypothetical protein
MTLARDRSTVEHLLRDDLEARVRLAVGGEDDEVDGVAARRRDEQSVVAEP